MDGIGVADRSLVSEQARIGRVWADVGGVEMGRTLIRSSEHCETQQSKGGEREKRSQTMHLIIRQGVGQAGLLPYTLLGYC